MALAAIAYLVPAAFGAGLVDSIAGGGGLVSLPALLAAGLPPQIAIATNKGQSTVGNAASFAAHWRLGNMDRERAPVAFGAGLLGACVGAAALLSMRPEPLRPLVAGLLVFAAAVVALRGRLSPGPSSKRIPKHPLATVAVIGVVLGVYDGFFGPGVGSLLIVAFTVAFGDTLTRASGNAKAANLGSNLAALIIFAFRGTVVWGVALPMALANVAGATIGSRFAVARGDRVVRAVVILVVAAGVTKLVLDMRRP